MSMLETSPILQITIYLLELIYYFAYFSTALPSNSCVFLSCRPLVVNTKFSKGLVDVEVSPVSWLGQERNTQLLDGTKVEE